MNYSKKIDRFFVAHLKRPLTNSGLGILEPTIQHQTLQLRWALALLHTSPDQRVDGSLDVAVSWLLHVITNIINPRLFLVSDLTIKLYPLFETNASTTDLLTKQVLTSSCHY